MKSKTLLGLHGIILLDAITVRKGNNPVKFRSDTWLKLEKPGWMSKIFFSCWFFQIYKIVSQMNPELKLCDHKYRKENRQRNWEVFSPFGVHKSGKFVA